MEEKVKTDRKEDRRKKYMGNDKAEVEREIKLSKTEVLIGTVNLNNLKPQWSLYVPHSGHYMYHQFNIQKFSVLPTRCIYVFCVDLRTNSGYFPIQH